MRKNSETFGFLQVINLDAFTPASIYIPTGVAHGYLSLEEKQLFLIEWMDHFVGTAMVGLAVN